MARKEILSEGNLADNKGGKHMKILIKNLRRILLVQLFIVGATLSITATNAEAVPLPCAIPETASEEVDIGLG